MKDVWHEVLRDKHESFKWSLLIDTAIETVRMYKQDYLLCKHAEELFGKSYLKEHNIVLDDDKKEAKICKKGS